MYCGHECEALFWGQIAFNFVKNITVPFHMPHGIQTKYIVCATSVPRNHKTI